MRVLIVGAGRVGTCLARLFASRGIAVALWNKEPLSAAARSALAADGAGVAVLRGDPPQVAPVDLVILAVSDPAVAQVVAGVAGWNLADRPVVHTSGSLGPLPGAGVLHPAFAFAGPDVPLAELGRVAFLVDGAPPQVAAARKLLDACALAHVQGAGHDRLLYHAGCVTASNFVALLGAAAGELFAAAGIGPEAHAALLESLLSSALANALARGFGPQALSGPAARGDADTLLAEAQRLAQEAPGQLALFVQANVALARLAGQESAAQRLERWWVGWESPPGA